MSYILTCMQDRELPWTSSEALHRRKHSRDLSMQRKTWFLSQWMRPMENFLLYTEWEGEWGTLSHNGNQARPFHRGTYSGKYDLISHCDREGRCWEAPRPVDVEMPNPPTSSQPFFSAELHHAWASCGCSHARDGPLKLLLYSLALTRGSPLGVYIKITEEEFLNKNLWR